MDAWFLVKMMASFLLGSIPFAVVAMWGTGIDIRQVGSGNPGFNNVLRVNKKRAIFTLIGDIGKGLLPVALFFGPGDPVNHGWAYGFAAVFGHCYSPFLRFDGGKGIATSAGVMLGLYPQWAAAGLAFFTLLRLTGSRMKWREAGAISSMTTWAFFTGLMWRFEPDPAFRFSLLMTIFLIWRHQKNIRNLFSRA